MPARDSAAHSPGHLRPGHLRPGHLGDDSDGREARLQPTPEETFRSRRQVVRALGLGAVGLAVGGFAALRSFGGASGDAESGDPVLRKFDDPAIGPRGAKLFPGARSSAHQIRGRTLTPEGIAARHNNFYEFTETKDRVWDLARRYPTIDSWKVEVKGLVAKPRTFGLEDLLKLAPIEERLYRFRCVERWAMQVPWSGYPLRTLLEKVQPLSRAKYVRFVSVLDRERLPGQRPGRGYPWPYYEALRLDEAMHDLTLVVLGIYGHALSMQFGAPLRIAVPWKYGYKSPKSIVGIELVERGPATFWNDVNAQEYGVYSNVNPKKPHPRWSQASETDIGTGERRPTLPYNGYAGQVAHLYTGREDPAPGRLW